MDSENSEIIIQKPIKCTLIGDRSVGKTSFIKAFQEGKDVHIYTKKEKKELKKLKKWGSQLSLVDGQDINLPKTCDAEVGLGFLKLFLNF